MRRLKSIWRVRPLWTVLILFIIAVAGAFVFAVHWAFFDLDRIEPGELLAEEVSPGGEYTIKTYLNNGGATVDYAVLGVLHFNLGDRKPRNVYWQSETEAGAMVWQDADTVLVNGQKIEVPGGKYDYRHP